MVKFEMMTIKSNGVSVKVVDMTNYGIIYNNMPKHIVDCYTPIGRWLSVYNLKHMRVDDMLKFVGHNTNKIDYAYPMQLEDDREFYTRRRILGDQAMFSYETCSYGEVLWLSDVKYDMCQIISKKIHDGEYITEEVRP